MNAQVKTKYQEQQKAIAGLLTLIQRALSKHAKDAQADIDGISYSHIGELVHIKEELKGIWAFLTPSGTRLETLQEIDQALGETEPMLHSQLLNDNGAVLIDTAETLQIDQALGEIDPALATKLRESKEAQAALLDHLREYGGIESDKREFTQSPWWAIIDEGRLKQMLSTDPDDVCQAVAHSVAGPYFSREMAQNYLNKLGRKFHPGAKVYCLGAMNAPEWTWFADRCKELAGINPQTGKAL